MRMANVVILLILYILVFPRKGVHCSQLCDYSGIADCPTVTSQLYSITNSQNYKICGVNMSTDQLSLRQCISLCLARSCAVIEYFESREYILLEDTQCSDICPGCNMKS